MLIEYITSSNNYNLIISVIELKKDKDSSVTNKILDNLLSIINSSENDHTFTLVDHKISKNVVTHLFMHQPELMIPRLTDWWEKDASKASEIMDLISEAVPIHYLCKNPNCSLNKTTFTDSRLLSFFTNHSINHIISTMTSEEFPAILYYILEDCRLVIQLCL